MSLTENFKRKRGPTPIPDLVAPGIEAKLEKATSRLRDDERKLDIATLAALADGASEAQRRERDRLKGAVATQHDEVGELERAHRAAIEQDASTKRRLQAALASRQIANLKRHMTACDDAMAKCTAALATAVREFQIAIDAAQEAVEQPLPRGMVMPDDTLHAPGKLHAAITVELFRLSGVRETLDANKLRRFPGAGFANIMQADNPEAIPVLIEQLRNDTANVLAHLTGEVAQ